MLTIVIQAGGESRRMGQDKGLLPFLGTRLIDRVIGRVQPVADRLVLISNHPENYDFLDIPVRTDLHPGTGALGGLFTALKTARTALVATVACDMPFVNAELLRYGRSILEQNPELDAAIPTSPSGFYEVLHAVYRRQRCLPAVARALNAGERKMISWLHEVKAELMPPERLQAFDPHQLAFLNLNTPAELAQAERLALSLEA